MNSATFRRVLLWIVVGLTGAFLLLPTLIIVPISVTNSMFPDFPPVGFSMRWYGEIFTNPSWRSATVTSLLVAICTMILAVVLGTMAAISLDSAIPGARWWRGFLLWPLVTPLIALTVGIYMVFAPFRLNGTFPGLVMAHTVLAIPFVVVTVTASLRLVNPNLKLVASGLGAGPFMVFRRVTLPLILPGVIAGAIFAFITSWDEAVISLFLTSPRLQTIPSLIWSQVRSELTPAIGAVGTILILVSAVGMLATQVFRGKSPR